MLPIIVGTVRNTVNLAVMDNKWQQKKESGRIFETIFSLSCSGFSSRRHGRDAHALPQ